MNQLLPHLQSLLESHFGIKEARPMQKRIIETLSQGEDLIALLPTGAGKSLCYQLPALTFPGLTIIISPLQSLMHDQVFSLQKKGISAFYLDSTLNEHEQKNVLEQVASRKVKLLYLSPEKLLSTKSYNFLLEQHISHLCIDEAHCVLSWGDSFRTEYRQLHKFINDYSSQQKRPVISAFTATATAQTVHELRKELSLQKARLFCLPFVRANLEYLILRPPSEAQKRQALLRILQHWRKDGSGSALVYTATRQEAESLTAWAQGYGFLFAETYHAGLKHSRKKKILERFLTKKRSLLFCTSAFGMGVDKPDIRLVLHHSPPTSLDAYAQEVGRAGRDGLPASCVLLFRSSDLERNLQFQLSSLKNVETKKDLQKKALLVENYALSSQCCGKILRSSFLHPLSSQIESFSCSCYRCHKVSWWDDLSTPQSTQTSLSQEQLRLGELKLRRKIQAEKLGVPPYYLGNDQLLLKVVKNVPKTWQELKEISGLGHTRLFYWGKDILRIMQQEAV